MVRELCGKPLARNRKRWCSKACNDRSRHSLPSREFNCPYCKRTVLVPAAKLYNRKFCSRSCARASYNAKFFRGPNNGRWRGGRAISYGPGWSETKKQVRERDQVCKDCGKTPEENGRALDVHHKEPYRYSGDNSLENLIALCRSCHIRAIDRGRRGAARFAGPQQLELRTPSKRELRRRRGAKRKMERETKMAQALALDSEGKSLRQIGRALGVSHQTISNWLTKTSRRIDQEASA